MPSLCIAGESGSPQLAATRSCVCSCCRCSQPACHVLRSARLRKDADATKIVTLSCSTTAAKHCAIVPSTRLFLTRSTLVTRVVSGPVMPYVWPVTHDGAASVRITSAPAVASKHVTIVLATLEA